MRFLILSATLFFFLSVLNAEDKGNKNEDDVIWKTNSKSKSFFYIDHKQSLGSEPDSFSLYKTENLMEARIKNYTVGIRKTVLVFTNKDFDESIKNHDYKYSNEMFNHGWEHWLDRVYFKGQWKPVQFTIGDFYESMNRGMAFSLKNDPVYGDNSIRGANITTSVKGFYLKAFGGKANPQIRDNATFQRLEEPDDWLTGMETGYKWKKFEFGVQYGYGNYGKYNLLAPGEGSYKRSIDTEKEFHLTGAYIALKNPFPRFSFYAGAVYVPFSNEDTTITTRIGNSSPKIENERTDNKNAASFYSNALYYFDFGQKKSRITFKIEAKMYNKFFLNYSRMENPDFQRRYFNPPTLLPKELQIDNEFDTWAVGGRITFNENHSGSKFFIDLVKGDSLGNKNGLPASKSGLIVEYKNEDFWYVATGAEKSWKRFSFSAGVGYHTTKGNNDDPKFKNSRDWIVPYLHLGSYVSKFSVKFTNDYYVKDMWLNGVHEMNYAHELKTVLDVSWNSRYFAALKNTLWKNNLENGSPAKWYTGGSLGIKYDPFKFYIFGGLEKGGYTCEGGACRFLPDFKGIKIEMDVAL